MKPDFEQELTEKTERNKSAPLPLFSPVERWVLAREFTAEIHNHRKGKL